MEYEEEDIDQQLEQLRQEKKIRDEKLKQRSNSVSLPKDNNLLKHDRMRPESVIQITIDDIEHYESSKLFEEEIKIIDTLEETDLPKLPLEQDKPPKS